MYTVFTIFPSGRAVRRAAVRLFFREESLAPGCGGFNKNDALVGSTYIHSYIHIEQRLQIVTNIHMYIHV